MKAAIYVDLETGGLLDDSPIIQLAAIAVDEATGAEVDTFQRKIRFNESAASPEALALNHYDRAVWELEAVEPVDAVRDFELFLQPHRCVEMRSRAGLVYRVAKLCGHNAATFDGPRLQRLFKAHGVFLPADPRIRCTIQRAMWFFDERPKLKPPQDFKLATLAAYFAIPTDGAHDALADVRMTIALAREIRLARAVAA